MRSRRANHSPDDKEIAFVGDTMNVAARLVNISKREGGAVVMTADYLKLVPSAVGEPAYACIGKTMLRGKQEQAEVYCALRGVGG